MNISKYNFNMINNADLRKNLSKKLEILKWEFSSSSDADLAHYKYNPRIAYDFVHTRNMKIIIKKILKENDNEFILPFIVFNSKNMIRILEENAYFFNDGIFYLKCADGKNEFRNQVVKNPDEIYKIINSKLREPNENFILEKSEKKMATFEGKIFDLRFYVLIVRIEKKYYTFLYPTIFANFNSEINKKNFIKSLGFKDADMISGLNPLMKNIYKIIQKTSTVIANYIELSRKIKKLENEMNGKRDLKVDFQFNLYSIDLLLDGEKKPYLSDINANPFFNLSIFDSDTVKENINIYYDILENFVNIYDKTKKINYQKSDFILLNEIPQDVKYKIIISLITNYDKFEYVLDNSYFLTDQGEIYVQNMIMENKDKLRVDNYDLLSKIGIKPVSSDKYIISENNSSISDSKTDSINYSEIGINDDFIKSKLHKLYIDERKYNRKIKFLGFLGKTLPVIGLLYGMKKAYN